METTAWVAIVGIIATLVGTLTAPLFTERMRRASERRHHLMIRRIDCYADLLRVTARAADNAQEWSAIPLADLDETDDEELNRIVSLSRVVASGSVYAQLAAFNSRVQGFNRLLMPARATHQWVHDEGDADTVDTFRQRMQLGELADEITATHKRLEKLIRQEMSE